MVSIMKQILTILLILCSLGVMAQTVPQSQDVINVYGHITADNGGKKFRTFLEVPICGFHDDKDSLGSICWDTSATLLKVNNGTGYVAIASGGGGSFTLNQGHDMIVTPNPATSTAIIKVDTATMFPEIRATIAPGGVVSFNTRTGAVTLSNGDVVTALTFTPVTNARTLSINGTTFDLTANRTWSVGTVTSVTAGTGLSGGVITGIGTISMPATGTPGTYGSATQVPVLTTDVQGRVTAVTNTPIAGLAWSVITAGLPTITYSGDATGSAALGSNVPLALATVNTNVGTFGDNHHTVTETINGKGLVTAVASTAIDYAWSNITSTPTTLALYGITDAYTKTASDTRFAPISVAGSVTSVIAGAGLSGGTITSTGTISMPNVGTPGTYGSATVVPVITTDAQGRSSITTATCAPPFSAVTGTIATSQMPTTITGASCTSCNITFDNWGRITVAANGSGGGMTNPMTTTGDMIYSSPGSTPVRLAAGTNNQRLGNSSGVPTWQNDIGTINVALDGQGSVISNTAQAFFTVPYGCTITNWYVTCDVAGSITFDIKRSGSSIVGAGNKPLVSSASSGNAAVSGWTSTTITANDVFNVVISGSPSTVTKATMLITCNKN